MKSFIAAIVAAALAVCITSYADGIRLDELSTERDIYASRAYNWERMYRDEAEVAEMLAEKLDIEAGAERVMHLRYAGEMMCTAYCTEKREHICGTGDGITKSGKPAVPGVTVAADLSIYPLGTWLYIEGIGIRQVQDTGAGVAADQLDVVVDGSHEDALRWDGYGKHNVWVLEVNGENK